MRRAFFLSLLAGSSALALLVAACTEGTTADCRNPDSGCGPGVDGSSAADASEAGPALDAAGDAPRDSAQDGSGTDASDAAADGADAGSDARLDADAQGG